MLFSANPARSYSMGIIHDLNSRRLGATQLEAGDTRAVAPPVIRRGTLADLDAIVAFHLESALAQRGLVLDPLAVRRGVERTLSGVHESGFYLLASDPGDGHPLGQLRVGRQQADWYGAEVWRIEYVYVTPAMRDRGIAKILLEGAKQAAADHGARYLYLLVGTSNPFYRRAVRRYVNGGFKKIPFEIMVLEL